MAAKRTSLSEWGGGALTRAHACACVMLLLALLPARAAATSPPDTQPHLDALRRINEERLREVIATLSGGGPRVAGYPACDELAEWLVGRFRAIGLRDVETMPFPVTVPVQKHAWLEIEEGAEPAAPSAIGNRQSAIRRIPLHAVWPNLVRTSTMPKGGATGELIYAGDGHLHRLNGRDVRGSIVLLDFNSRGRWENAAMLGAAACVLIGTQDLAAGELRNKYYDVPLDMPRFWIGEAEGLRLRDLALAEDAKPVGQRRPVRVTLHARVDWDQRLTRNVYGFLPGTDPELKRELIVVEAYYDSISVVPTLAPGAQQACGLAALLAMAEHFAERPPKRSMLFLASSGHAQAIAGVRHFFDAYDRKVADLNEALASANQDVRRLEQLREAIAPLPALRGDRDAAQRALAWLEAHEPEELKVWTLPPDPDAGAPAEDAEPPPYTRYQRAKAEAERLGELVTAREKSQDPSAVFGGGEVVMERGWHLMRVAGAAAVVLVLASLLFGWGAAAEAAAEEPEADAGERAAAEEGVAADEVAPEAEGDVPPSAEPEPDAGPLAPPPVGRARGVLVVLAVALVALGVVAAVVGGRDLTPSQALSLRPELLAPAAFGSALVMLVTVALVGVGWLHRLAQEAAVAVGFVCTAFAVVAAGAHWFLWLLLVGVPAAVGIAALALRRRQGWHRARNVVFFLSLGLTAVLQATFWSGTGGVPAAVLPGVGLVLTLVLLCREVGAVQARQMVVGVALSFALLFLVGMTPQRQEAEADKLREQMLERLRDPMRLRAEACAKKVYRLRTALSLEDAEGRAALLAEAPELADADAETLEARIHELDKRRLAYKRFSWRDGYDALSPEETALFEPVLEDARRDLRFRLRHARQRVAVLRGKVRLAARLAGYEVTNFETKPEKGIYLFVALELSSRTAQLGAFREGWLYRLPGSRDVVDTYSPLAERLEGFARELEMRTDFVAARPRAQADYLSLQAHERIYQDVLRGKKGRAWHTYIPRMGFSSEVASLAGVPGITFATLNDERHRVDSPADTIDHVALPYLVTQTRFLVAMMDEMANDRELVGHVRFKSGFGRVKGKLTMELSGRRLPDQPVPNAMALLYRGRWEPLMGARRRLAQLTSPDGEFEYTGICNRPRARWRWMRVDGFGFHPDDGRITMAVNRAMLKKYPNGFSNNDLNRSLRPVLFDCEAVALYNLFDQRYFDQLWGIRILDARRESDPIRYGYDKWWINGVIYLEPLTPFKFIMTYRLRGVRLALLNASAEHPEGVGYRIDQVRREPLVPLLVARDFSHLVEYRLSVLEDRGIQNQRLRALHEEAKAYLVDADRYLAERQYDRAIDAARSAWAYESRAYPDVQATIHDTVAGLLFYVALLLPFAYCVERLLVSASRIAVRATATVGIMAVAIAILWQVHPAFELSNNPFIVILAFFLLALGGLTMAIIVARFEDEMRKLERARSGIEVADVSRMSAFGAAFALGISNMRRRKVRTGLTMATLIILTFAIMSFTSTRTRPVEREQALEAQPSYKGVLIRRKGWATMSSLVYGTLYNKYRTEAIVAPRIWRGPKQKGEQSYIDLRSEDGRRKFTVKSLLGLSTEELRMLSGELLRGLGAREAEPRKLLEAGRWFERNNANEILLPRRVANALGIRDEGVGTAKVQLFGIEFTVAGIYSGESFESFLDLNGEPVSPVDWTIEQEAADQEKEAAAEAESETGEDTRELQYIHVPADEMAILPYETLWTLGGTLSSVAVAFDPDKGTPGEFTRPIKKPRAAPAPTTADAPGPRDGPLTLAEKKQSIAAMRRHLKDRLTLTLYFGDEDGVYKFTAADVPSFQGLRNVFVPLLIAFLIVLNTMLGSVHERIGEVGIYSSVGLAPGHISMLFIAEAVGLATMSAVAGYLVSQTVVKVLFTLGWLDTQHMFLNYSSMATVGAIVLVVVMVLASTAYPAHMVSKVASPDIERRWTLPPVTGSRIELRLPYSLNAHDVPGLMLFLYNYVRAHEETSLGVFTVRDVELKPEDGQLRLTFSAWLAPYDLGVYQSVTVATCPAEDAGHDNVTVAIDRQSGEVGAWTRNNQTFLNQLRKQFLIWRAIGHNGRARHVEEARERFDLSARFTEAEGADVVAEESSQQSAVSGQADDGQADS